MGEKRWTTKRRAVLAATATAAAPTGVGSSRSHGIRGLRPAPSAIPLAGDDLNRLVSAAADGDRDAISGVLDYVQRLVMRYCRARVGSHEKTFVSADHLTQEVCLAVLAILPSYRDQDRSFLALVYGIAAHKVADAYQSAVRNRAKPVPEVPNSPEPTDQMTTLLSTLPDEQREILVLRVAVGLSVTETAEAVGSPPGAVQVAQHRALNRLRTALAST